MKANDANHIRKMLASALMLMLLGLFTLTALADAGDLAATASGEMVLEDAKTIALQSAQLQEADVLMTLMQKERDDGRMEFEIEFIYNGMEYEFTIDAANGAIIESSRESISKREAERVPGSYLTMNQAKEKALAEAGVAAGQATFTELELDLDDSRVHYEIAFTDGSQNYTLEMDAITGEILRYAAKAVRKK